MLNGLLYGCQVEFPKNVVRKDEEPMDLDLIIKEMQKKLCL